MKKSGIEDIEESAIKDGWAIKRDEKYWYAGVGNGDDNLKVTASKDYLGNLKSVFLTYLRAGSHGEANMFHNDMMGMGRTQAIQRGAIPSDGTLLVQLCHRGLHEAPLHHAVRAIDQ